MEELKQGDIVRAVGYFSRFGLLEVDRERENVKGSYIVSNDDLGDGYVLFSKDLILVCKKEDRLDI